MTTTTHRPQIRVNQWNVLRSEWVKLRSVRSTWWSLGTALLLTIGFGLIACFAAKSGHARGDLNDPAGRSLVGANLALLAFGVLGVLFVAGEYTTGMIRSSMMAVPKRLPVLWGKAIVFAFVSFVVALILVLVAFFGGQAILGSSLNTSFSAPGVPREVLGTALYIMLSGVFALALGAIVRNSAAAITGFVAILFVIPVVGSLISSWVADHLVPYLPFQAGASFNSLTHSSNTLQPVPGLLVFIAWTVLLLVVASVLMVKRDV